MNEKRGTVYTPGTSRRRGRKRRGLEAWAARAGIVVIALALGACAGQLPAPVDSRGDEVAVTEPATETPPPAPRVTTAIPTPTTPETPPAPDTALPPVPETGGGEARESEAVPRRLAALNPAIVDLLNAANRHSTAGRHDSAVAALERALQIEPADAGLWHRLARIRLDQGKADLAEALAAKSNSLAAGDPNLQVQNWRVIAKARGRLGDASGASDALARAARLQP